MILAETPRRKLVTQLVNWGHWFALLNIVIAVTIAAIYILNSPAPGSVIGTIILIHQLVKPYWFSDIFWFCHAYLTIVLLGAQC